MSDTFSKSEIESKLALVEERVDHKFDRLLAEIKEGCMAIDRRFAETDAKMDRRFAETDAKIEAKFDSANKDISWLKLLMTTFFIPLSIAVLTLSVAVISLFLQHH